jgi:UDPglucose--hexose-1-phosphate uridylyltransferase
MELRKDPVTQSWILVGDEEDQVAAAVGVCPFCQPQRAPIYTVPGTGVRVYPHPDPIYRIEGEEGRAAEGIYDRMRTVGAHEVVVENNDHARHFPAASDQEIGNVLRAFAIRIIDLKKDLRFRYVTVFKNRGALSGEDVEHPHSQITATPFIPRRIVYELRSAKQYYQMKERCVFCDIVRQEESFGLRVVEATQNFVAVCPFASRVPYELWVLPRYHSAAFEDDFAERRDPAELAGVLRRSVQRVEKVADSFHMVLHTTPNSRAQKILGPQWVTLADDYHWHFEVLPIAEKRTKSYSIKEVYYSSVSPERAATRLRQAL